MTVNKELMTGLTDACGFIGGALGGLFLGRAFGLDAFAQGYDNASMIGIVLCGLGGGLGLQLTRWVRTKVNNTPKD